MKKITCYFLIIYILFLNNLSVFSQEQIDPKTMLEIRNIQTRTFNTPNEKQVMKAVINTLQDNGFIILNIEDDIGYLRAKKEIKLKRTNKKRVVGYSSLMGYYIACLAISFGLNPAAMYGMATTSLMMKNEIAPHTVIFDSNVDVEKIGKKTKVRFIVIEKVLENADGYTTVKSSPRKVVRHYEPIIYQEFFKQLEKNLFLIQNNV